MPFENVLGEEGRGVRVLMSGLDFERVVLAGIGLGIMAACLDEVMHQRQALVFWAAFIALFGFTTPGVVSISSLPQPQTTLPSPFPYNQP